MLVFLFSCTSGETLNLHLKSLGYFCTFDEGQTWLRVSSYFVWGWANVLPFTSKRTCRSLSNKSRGGGSNNRIKRAPISFDWQAWKRFWYSKHGGSLWVNLLSSTCVCVGEGYWFKYVSPTKRISLFLLCYRSDKEKRKWKDHEGWRQGGIAMMSPLTLF